MQVLESRKWFQSKKCILSPLVHGFYLPLFVYSIHAGLGTAPHISSWQSHTQKYPQILYFDFTLVIHFSFGYSVLNGTLFTAIIVHATLRPHMALRHQSVLLMSCVNGGKHAFYWLTVLCQWREQYFLHLCVNSGLDSPAMGKLHARHKANQYP